MSNNRFTVLVDKMFAQQARKLLELKGIWDKKRKLKKLENDKIAIPVKASHDSNIVQLVKNLCSEFNICMEICHDIELPPSKSSSIETPYDLMVSAVQSLGDRKGIVLSKVLKEVPHHWERHGDLLLLPEGAFGNAVWAEFGEELWRCVAHSISCDRVARKGTISTDGFRSPQVTMLLGNSGWVEHQDNGIRYTYDVTKCMFSAGNITEKLRIADFDCRGQIVLDLYAGIGYFTLPYLVHAKADHVHACEWNPDSVEALKRNVTINRVADRCTVHFGDNRKVCPRDIADRVNLGLIPSSEAGWPVACSALKPKGGILHIHSNVTAKHCSDSDAPTSFFGINTNDSNKDISQEGFPKLLSKSFSNVEIQENCSDTDDVSVPCSDIELTSEKMSLKCATKNTRRCVEDDLCSDQISLSKQEIWRNWGKTVAKQISVMCSDLRGKPWQTKVLHIEHVKSYAPHIDHLVLDLLCEPHACDT